MSVRLSSGNNLAGRLPAYPMLPDRGKFIAGKLPAYPAMNVVS